jgi:hypothetical protein
LRAPSASCEKAISPGKTGPPQPSIAHDKALCGYIHYTGSGENFKNLSHVWHENNQKNHSARIGPSERSFAPYFVLSADLLRADRQRGGYTAVSVLTKSTRCPKEVGLPEANQVASRRFDQTRLIEAPYKHFSEFRISCGASRRGQKSCEQADTWSAPRRRTRRRLRI